MPLPLPAIKSTRSTARTEINKREAPPSEAAGEQAAKRLKLDVQTTQASSDVENAKRTVLAYKALYPAEVGTFLDAYRSTPFDGLSDESILLCAEGLENKYHRGALPSFGKVRGEEILDFESDIAQAGYVLQSLDDLRPSQQFTRSHEVSVHASCQRGMLSRKWAHRCPSCTATGEERLARHCRRHLQQG